MTPEQKLQQLEQKVKRLEKDSCVENFDNKFADFNSNIPNQGSVRNSEIGFIKLWNVIWLGRLKILIATTLFAVVSVFYALSLPNIYKSEALLVPNSKENGGSSLNALAGQFGGLASLAGLNLGSGGTDKTNIALEVLKSREFLYNFIVDNKLKVNIMAVKGWDINSNSLVYDENIFDVNEQRWVRKVEEPFKPEPSLHETYLKFLKHNFRVSKDDDSGMIKISVEHYSPFIAKKIVDRLIQGINTTIKQQDMEEAIKSIKYLRQELDNTNLSDAQSMFYQLIEQQQQTLMLTKVRDDYVLKVIDRAVIPEEKERPQRALICVLITFLGGLLSIMILLVNHFVKNKE